MKKIIALGLLIGCSDPMLGTDTGNATALRIEFVGQGDVTLTEARIVVKAIDFDPLSLCLTEINTPDAGDDDEADLPGPFVVDLLTNTSLPETEAFEIFSGNFCEMDLDFDKLDEAEVPAGIEADDPIIGKALIVHGTRDDGTPFEVCLSQDDKFKLAAESANGFIIAGSDAETRLFVGFDLTTWFTGVDLNRAAVSEGMILIDDENNTELQALIVENIKQSARLFTDLNNNGILDEEETAEGFVLASGEDEVD